MPFGSYDARLHRAAPSEPPSQDRWRDAHFVDEQLGLLVRMKVVNARGEAHDRVSVDRNRNMMARIGKEFLNQQGVGRRVEYALVRMHDEVFVAALQYANFDRHRSSRIGASMKQLPHFERRNTGHNFVSR